MKPSGPDPGDWCKLSYRVNGPNFIGLSHCHVTTPDLIYKSYDRIQAKQEIKKVSTLQIVLQCIGDVRVR